MIGVDIINYYKEIKTKLIDTEVYDRIKDYSKERHRVMAYYEVGKMLYEAGSEYGEDIIGKYAEKLVIEVGKKYNSRTLRRIRQFYRVFSKENWSPMATKLSWSHYTELLPIKDVNKLEYYLNLSMNNRLSRNELRFKIKSKEYERLPEKTRNKLIKKEETNLEDFVKNPIVLKSKNKYEFLTEKNLQDIIMEDIPSFLKELGEGYSFISNEYKIKIGESYNYIDLLLYNYKFKCFVVVELKVCELRKEHIGQIGIYMNYIDKNIKSTYDDKSIGIIICRRDNKFIIEYCSDRKILSREYQLN